LVRLPSVVMESRLLAVGPTTTRSGRLRPNRATPSHGNGTFALHGTGVVPTSAEPPSDRWTHRGPRPRVEDGAAERPPRSDVVVHRELPRVIEHLWLFVDMASDLHFHGW
jgi:hypothetical protein